MSKNDLRIQLNRQARTDPRLLPTRKSVFNAILFQFCGPQKRHCWPGNEAIAKQSGESVRTVRRAPKDLEKLNYLRINEAIGRGNKREIIVLGMSTSSAVIASEKGDSRAAETGSKKGTPSPRKVDRLFGAYFRGDNQGLNARSVVAPIREESDMQEPVALIEVLAEENEMEPYLGARDWGARDGRSGAQLSPPKWIGWCPCLLGSAGASLST